MPVQKLTPERRRELTRRTLVEAAAEVFARRGFHAASLDEIAEHAGFTRGAIYSNFGSKEDLLLAVLDWHNETTLEAYSQVDIGGIADDVTAAAQVWSKIIHGQPELVLLAMEFRLHALRDPAFRRRLAESHRRYVARIAQWVEENARAHGVRLKVPPEDFGEIGWAISDGLLLFSAVDTERPERYDRLAEVAFSALAQSMIEDDPDDRGS